MKNFFKNLKENSLTRNQVFMIQSVLYLIVFFLASTAAFNFLYKAAYPQMYGILEKKTGIKMLGYLGLIGKKMYLSNGIIPLVAYGITKTFWYQSLFIGFVAMGIVYIILYFASHKKEPNTSQGSAKWGGIKDINFLPGKDKYFGSSLTSKVGVVLGRFKGITLRDNNKTHICVTAPTRTGKGVSIIIPTLIDSWNESVIVLDIKGENYQLTSGARKEKFNNLILRFAPKSKNSSGYNPLSEVRFMTEYEMEDVRLLVDIIMEDDSGGNKDPYWNNSAADLLIGIIFYELYKNFLQNPKFIIENGIKKPISNACMSDVTDFITDPNANVTIKERLQNIAQKENLYDKFTKDETTKQYVIDRLKKLYGTEKETVERTHPKMARYLNEKANLPDETLGSIVGSAKVKLSIFEIPTVKANTNHSDFRIYDLMNYKKPVSLYLVVPPADITSLSPLIKMLLLQMVNILTPEINYATKIGHKWRCLMLLDEFASIGKMKILEKGIGYVAGYGMKMMLILQSLDQLYNIYGKENGFLSNCQAQVFYTTNDQTTADYVSKLLGKQTIRQFTQSNKSIGTITKTSSEQFVGKDLLSSDEAGRFPSDKIIIKLSGRNPIKSDKIVYFEEKEYSSLTKLPFIYSESCFDPNMQYIRLPQSIKKEIPDFKFNYFPYPKALKGMINEVKEMHTQISNVTTEDEAQMKIDDVKAYDDFQHLKSVYINLATNLKLYLKTAAYLKEHHPEIYNIVSSSKKVHEQKRSLDNEKEKGEIKVDREKLSESNKEFDFLEKDATVKKSSIEIAKQEKPEESDISGSEEKANKEGEENVQKEDEISHPENENPEIEENGKDEEDRTSDEIDEDEFKNYAKDDDEDDDEDEYGNNDDLKSLNEIF